MSKQILAQQPGGVRAFPFGISRNLFTIQPRSEKSTDNQPNGVHFSTLLDAVRSTVRVYTQNIFMCKWLLSDENCHFFFRSVSSGFVRFPRTVLSTAAGPTHIHISIRFFWGIPLWDSKNKTAVLTCGNCSQQFEKVLNYSEEFYKVS
jgi:hypothetical protein